MNDFNIDYFSSYSSDIHPNQNLIPNNGGGSSPTLIIPLIIASGTLYNQSGTSQYDPPSTSQLSCTVLSARISVHNIVQYNRGIYLSNSLSVNWFPNQPKMYSYYDTGLGQFIHPCLITGLSQGGWAGKTCLLSGGLDWVEWANCANAAQKR